MRVFLKPPVGEPSYVSLKAVIYRREIWCCSTCGHYRAIHDLPLRRLYNKNYADVAHGGGRMKERFDQIMSLSKSVSDNFGRVNRVVSFARERGLARAPAILDVGSGLCVFLAVIKKFGWRCTALDPDPRAVHHAKQVAKVNARCGDFRHWVSKRLFNVISFNKVLEHVVDPVIMLRKARTMLRPGGFVYIEVPDGESAVQEGFHREEFFVDHWHVFSASSLALMGSRSGLGISLLKRIREPSGKFTLCAFLDPQDVVSVARIGATTDQSTRGFQ